MFDPTADPAQGDPRYVLHDGRSFAPRVSVGEWVPPLDLRQSPCPVRCWDSGTDIQFRARAGCEDEAVTGTESAEDRTRRGEWSGHRLSQIEPALRHATRRPSLNHQWLGDRRCEVNTRAVDLNRLESSSRVSPEDQVGETI